MPHCLVYRGRGVGPLGYRELLLSLKHCLPNGWTISSVSQKQLSDTKMLHNSSLIVFPGGRDVPYHEDLAGQPNQNIRHFVQEGGRYLGICAGAYYGSASVIFEQGFPLEVTGRRELAFFPGVAEGCVYNRGRFQYDSEEIAEVCRIGLDENELDLYYNGGCAFLDTQAHPSVQTLGHYTDVPGSPAAILLCQVQKGKALLSGPHLDFSPDRLLQRGMDAKKVRRLEQANPQRLLLFRRLLAKLLS